MQQVTIMTNRDLLDDVAVLLIRIRDRLLYDDKVRPTSKDINAMLEKMGWTKEEIKQSEIGVGRGRTSTQQGTLTSKLS